jgi:hypothetical protein
MKSSAILSTCGTYRYELRRTWNASKPAVLFIGLNPSTADADREDGTSRVCLNYARRWRFGTLLIGNLFALRSRFPQVLKAATDPIGPHNDEFLRRLESEAALVVCAWGDPGSMFDRDKQVLASLSEPHCLIRLKSGRPGHPLYKAASLRPIPL